MKTLEIEPIFKKTFEITKKHFWLLLGSFIIVFAVQLAVGLISEQFSGGLEYLLMFISWIVSIFLSAGLVRLTLNVAQGRSADIDDLWSQGHNVLSYLAASVLQGIAVFVGLIFLVIPGIIIALMFSQTAFAVVDGDMGPIKALKRSKEITRGYKGKLFLLYLALALFNILGLLALGVGLLFTIPASSIVLALVYMTLEENAEKVAR